MLFLNNDDVRSVLTIDMAIAAIRQAYQEIVDGEGICRPRMDIRMPTRDPQKVYRWASMEGGSANTGYFAIRFHSNVMHEAVYEGGIYQADENHPYQGRRVPSLRKRGRSCI